MKGPPASPDHPGVRVLTAHPSDRPSRRPSALFVCTGNICRSPLAEGAMRAEARARGLPDAEIDGIVDSAGLGAWHLGDPPDPRARATAGRHGLDLDGQRARQVTAGDFTRFTHILALDHSHLAALRKLAPPRSAAQLTLLMDHAPGRAGSSVDDPYYGPASGFETTYRDVRDACAGLATLLWGPAPARHA